MMPADVQMNYSISSVHVQWFSHRKIRADDHNVVMVTMIAHATGTGKCIRRASSSFGAAVVCISDTER